MKRSLIVMLLVLNLLFLNSCCYADFPTAKMTISVVDDDGNPVSGANAGFTTKGIIWSKAKLGFVSKEGLTDAHGMYTATFDAINDVYYGADKTGYYKSSGKYHFREKKFGRWQPWNPEIKVVLRKKDQPGPDVCKGHEGLES